MGITRAFTEADVQATIDTFLAKRRKKVIAALQYAGESCVAIARDRFKAGKQYRDRTGNLTSSMGYVVYDSLKTVTSNFVTIGNADKGVREGKAYAQKVAKAHPSSIILVVVAGMDYAQYVANRGYDVLDSAEAAAKTIVPKLLKDIRL